MTFMKKLAAAWRDNDSLVCVGLDPEPARFPARFATSQRPIFDFNKAIIDATCDIVCAYKPQIAHYAAARAEDQLADTIAYIRERAPKVLVILDSKRGDIGSTAAYYAREAFERYGADAVTVNPYMGGDTIEPFSSWAGRGVILLCRTSNAGAGDLQDRLIDGRPLYQHVAMDAATKWNSHGNLCLVMGATSPSQLADVRALVGDMPLLVPGVGAQGGDAEAVIRFGATKDGTGLIINSSRGVLYASQGEDFAEAARAAVLDLRAQTNAARRSKP